VVRGYLRSLRSGSSPRTAGAVADAVQRRSCGGGEAASIRPAAAVGAGGGVARWPAWADPDAIAFDMGGTSCDVSLIRGGSAGRSTERAVGGLPVRLPMLDIHTVGAEAAASPGWTEARFAGPRSAGAEPGPACYGAAARSRP
jgi:N-methylhydantoinase A